MKSVWRKGFTLIELLVVIAIVSILALIIIGTVGVSRNKAADTRVVSSIRQLRVLAEEYYDVNNLSYTGFDVCIQAPTSISCKDDPTAKNVITLKTEIEAANEQSGSVFASVDEVDKKYCLSARLKSDPGIWVCAASTGQVSIQGSASSPCATEEQGGTPGICNFI